MAEFMDGTVDAPVIGRVKKAYVFVPLGIAGAYVAWRWYQASRDAADDGPPTSSGLYASDDLSEYGLSTTGGATTVTGNTGAVATDATAPAVIDDNAEWTQKAVELLGNAGYDSATVYGALGEFLGRRALDKTEASIARAALAAAGQPPVGGPFSVIEEAATATGTLPAPTNVRPWEAPTSSVLAFQWDAVNGAAYYRIFRTDQGDEPMGASADVKFRAKGLAANRSYSFYVRAVSSTGKIGGKSNVITLKTAAVKLAKPARPTASNVKATTLRATTKAVPGAQYYRWYVNGTPSGASDKPYYDLIRLRANTTHKITVKADTANQTPGPSSDPLTVKTKKK